MLSHLSGGMSNGSADISMGTVGTALEREAGLWHTMAHHNNKLYILGGWADAILPAGAYPTKSHKYVFY